MGCNQPLRKRWSKTISPAWRSHHWSFSTSKYALKAAHNSRPVQLTDSPTGGSQRREAGTSKEVAGLTVPLPAEEQIQLLLFLSQLQNRSVSNTRRRAQHCGFQGAGQLRTPGLKAQLIRTFQVKGELLHKKVLVQLANDKSILRYYIWMLLFCLTNSTQKWHTSPGLRITWTYVGVKHNLRSWHINY